MAGKYLALANCLSLSRHQLFQLPVWVHQPEATTHSISHAPAWNLNQLSLSINGVNRHDIIIESTLTKKQIPLILVGGGFQFSNHLLTGCRIQFRLSDFA